MIRERPSLTGGEKADSSLSRKQRGSGGPHRASSPASTGFWTSQEPAFLLSTNRSTPVPARELFCHPACSYYGQSHWHTRTDKTRAPQVVLKDTPPSPNASESSEQLPTSEPVTAAALPSSLGSLLQARGSWGSWGLRVGEAPTLPQGGAGKALGWSHEFPKRLDPFL